MTARNYNNVTTLGTLSAPASPTATTFTTTSFTQYPAVPFTATISRNQPDEEVVLVTSASTGTLTVTRGYDGTVGQTHAAGATVEHTAVALDYTEANTHVNATAGVHGVTGSVVGTQGSQTLLTKTLTSPLCNADVTLGDAVVAAVPSGAGTRNLFRGIGTDGNNKITVDASGNINAASIGVTGGGSVSGNATVGGTLGVTGAATLGGAVTATGLVTANGGVTVPSGQTVAANGGLTGTTVNVTSTVNAGGTIKGPQVEVTSGVYLDGSADLAAPGVALQAALYKSSADHGLYVISNGAAKRRVKMSWGSGTTPPSSGPLDGDTYRHTTYGPMTYTGSVWLPDGPLHGAVVSATTQVVAGSGNWTTAALTLPASVVPGMTVRVKIGAGYWANGGGNVAFTVSASATGATISNAEGGTTTVLSTASGNTYRELYLTVTAASPSLTVTYTNTTSSSFTAGGTRLDFTTGYSA